MALEKATVTNTDTGERIEVMFNPEEYSLTKDNNFAQSAVPGLSSPLLQFAHGSLKTLDMELFFDTYEEHRVGNRLVNRAGDDVRLHTNRVVGLMDINPETHAPPVLLFTWGDLTLTCVLARAAQRFTMFLETGVPVRARVQVSFNEWVDAAREAKTVKRRTADYSRLYVVGQGESLSAIAARVYRDARMWRPIALANDIANPRRLPAGLQLIVPRLPYRDPLSGDVYGAEPLP
jgi:nucleoid-associated protein YgaU